MPPPPTTVRNSDSSRSLVPGALLTRRIYDGGRREVLYVGHDGRIEIDVRRTDDSLRLRVFFADPSNWIWQPNEIVLRVRAAAAEPFEVQGLDTPVRAALVAGLHPFGKTSDIFSALNAMVSRETVRANTLTYDPQIDFPIELTCSDGGGRHNLQYCDSVTTSMRIVHQLFREAAIYALSLLDSEIARIARRFSPCARLWVYERMVQDWSGRVAQLAISCPGLLLFAFAMDESRYLRPVSDDILRLTVQGARINHTAANAVADWATVLDETTTNGGEQATRIWKRVGDAGSRERRQMESDHSFLVRRASPRVAPDFLTLPPPLGFARDDVPHGVWENARWHRVMKTRIALVAPRTDDNEARIRGLSAFASRSFRDLHPAGHGPKVHQRMGSLIRFVRHAERNVTRTSSPRKLLDECRSWNSASYLSLEFVPRSNRRELDAHNSLECGWIDEWSAGGVVASRIKTVGELLREGHRQRNCVAGRVDSALEGKVSFYSVKVGRRRITVEVTHPEHGNSFASEMAGFANREVSEEEVAAMAPWLSEVSSAPRVDLSSEHHETETCTERPRIRLTRLRLRRS